VYYTQLAADVDVRTEWRSIKKFARALKDMVNLYVVRVTDEDKLPAGKLMYYPNLEIGNAKKKGEKVLKLDRDSKDVTKLVEQVGEVFDARYDPISSDSFQPIIMLNSQRDQKNTIYTMYRGKIPLAFKALTTHPVFFDGDEHYDDVTFIAIEEPDLSQMGGLSEEMLPIIGIIEKIDADF